MSARALEFVAPHQVRVVDTDVPDPARGQIVVRTLYSGISAGTELLAYRGDVDPQLSVDETIGSLGGTFSYPFRYGYSCVGVVERSSHSIPSGTLVFVFHPHQDRFVCSGRDAVVVSGVDPRLATMFPLVETGLQITLDADSVFGEIVLVMGLGTVGLLTSSLLKRAGARVVATDPSQVRRDLADELGVETIAPDDLRRRFGGGVPLVVEVSGNPDALAAALGLLGHEGTALVASWYGTKPVILPLGGDFHRRRLTIRSTQVSTIPARLAPRWTIEGRRRLVTQLLGELPLKDLATHEFAFDRAQDAFAALDRGDDSLLHAALVYERD
ncbi:MAG: zinc-binding alcohol dehydrogenase [Actinomycetota bacterium]|nr:zinc-binding alcohol dehydrogenase [Actinomycetota bacterium]